MSTSKTETTVAARVHAIVASYVNGARNTNAAGVAAMIDYANTLQGVSAITDQVWKDTYQEGVLADLKASGIVSEKTVPMTASRLKLAAQGVTHGIPHAGKTFTQYVEFCRSDESRAILGKAPKADADTLASGAGSNASAPSATADPAQFMADAFDDNAKGRKEARALAETLGGAEMAMGLMIVCDGSVSLAKLTHAILSSREPEFRQWASDLLAAPVAKVAAKRTLRD